MTTVKLLPTAVAAATTTTTKRHSLPAGDTFGTKQILRFFTILFVKNN